MWTESISPTHACGFVAAQPVYCGEVGISRKCARFRCLAVLASLSFNHEPTPIRRFDRCHTHAVQSNRQVPLPRVTDYWASSTWPTGASLAQISIVGKYIWIITDNRENDSWSTGQTLLLRSVVGNSSQKGMGARSVTRGRHPYRNTFPEESFSPRGRKQPLQLKNHLDVRVHKLGERLPVAGGSGDRSVVLGDGDSGP